VNLARLTFSRAAFVLADLFADAPASESNECAYLLRPELAWREEGNTASEGGIKVHAPLAAVLKSLAHEPPDTTELRAMYGYGRAWMREAGLFAYDGRPRATIRAELAFAYDAVTDVGRELEDPEGAPARWYADPEWRAGYAGPGGPIRDTEICGRLDVVGPAMDEEGPYLFLADYKCHFGPEMGDAGAQLAIGALAAARAWRLDRVRAVGVHLWADQEAREERYDLGPAHLDRIAEHLARLAAAPAPSLPNDGPWCGEHHCPARASCPVALEATAELEALIPAEALVRRAPLAQDPATDEDADSQLTALDLVLEVLKAKRDRLKAFADARGGVVRKGGKVWSGKLQTNETPDLGVPGAIDVMDALGLYTAVEWSTSFAAITEVAGKEAADTAREALRAAGALKSATFPVYRDRKPAKAGPAAADEKSRRAS
jgi:hypothetical protein